MGRERDHGMSEHGVRAMAPGAAEEGERVSLTLSLPPRLARAITGAAEAAGRIDADGRVVMDHMMIVPEESPLWIAPGEAHCDRFRPPSKAC